MLAPHYGFSGLEITKLEKRTHSLSTGDFNSDGLTDVAAVDNSHSRIDLLLQRKEFDPTIPADELDTNEVASHQRFEKENIPVSRQVFSLAVGDWDGDGRTDLASLAEGDRLTLHFQPEEGLWTRSREFRLPGLTGRPWSIAAGDLNSDDRVDLAILGEKRTYLLYQTEEGIEGPPETMLNTAQRFGIVRIADLDGDGRADLSYLFGTEEDTHFALRLQNADGRLGAERTFEIGKIRGVTLAEMDEQAGHELLSIDARTNRAEVRRLQPAEDPADAPPSLVYFGFEGDRRERGLAAGDVDGDALVDLVLTNPDGAEILLYRQHPQAGLTLGVGYPAFLEVDQVRIADIDGDGRNEVLTLSERESVIGVSRFQAATSDDGDAAAKPAAGGRLSFPEPIPDIEKPVAFELVRTPSSGSNQLVVYLSQLGKKPSDGYELRAVQHAGAGWQSVALGPDDEPLKVGLSGEPTELLRVNANDDEYDDVLVFQEFGRDPQLLLGGAEGMRQVSAAKLQVEKFEPGAAFARKSQQDEQAGALLVAQESFARAVKLVDEDKRWQVLDQFNASETGAKITGVAALNMDDDPADEIVLVDTGVNRLRIHKQQGGQYRPWKEVTLSDFDYRNALVADLDGNGREDLVLLGKTRFGILLNGHEPLTLERIAGWEPDRDESTLLDLNVGDLNDDNVPDVIVIDAQSHDLDLLAWIPAAGGEDAEPELVEALSFPVFEEKSFRRAESSSTEPREIVIADVTGDGRNDLLLLSHDRLLVYPQDQPPAE